MDKGKGQMHLSAFCTFFGVASQLNAKHIQKLYVMYVARINVNQIKEKGREERAVTIVRHTILIIVKRSERKVLEK